LCLLTKRISSCIWLKSIQANYFTEEKKFGGVKKKFFFGKIAPAPPKSQKKVQNYFLTRSI
jgi:hypothetical protein